MDEIVLIVVLILLVIVVLPLVALAKAFGVGRAEEELRLRVAELETELRKMRRAAGILEKEEPQVVEEVEEAPVAPAPLFAEPAWRAAPPVAAPPPLHPPPRPTPAPVLAAAQRYEERMAEPAAPIEQEVPSASGEPDAPFAWEQFMGARLFAWIGGLALFLGIAFFVKYSFEHNLIPPAMRVAIGFAAGLGLIAGGRLMKRKENAVTAQTLCATGIVVLYAVTFACRSYYHFPFFAVIPTFTIMSLITCVAFVLAVGMDAMVIAILGVAGGFLTPVLLSTGQDNPLGLFGYIAFLDLGLLAIARRKSWQPLPALGAVGTVLMEGAWIGTFFETGNYAEGSKIFIVMAVLAGFQALFLAATARVKGENEADRSAVSAAAMLVGAVALIGAFYFLGFETLGHRPILLCGYLFAVDLGLIALSLVDQRAAFLRSISGVAAYLFLGAWTQTYLTNASLDAALGCYFVFALLHSFLPILLQSWQKTKGSAWAHVFPACSLVLALMPIFEFHDVSLVIWPFVLMIDALAFIVAMATLTLAPVLIVLVLTLVAIGGSLLDVPAALTGLPTDLFLLGGFAILFMVGSAWAARRLAPKDAAAPQLFGSVNDPANLAVQIPSLSAALPFLLLIMVIVRLPLHDPSSVFGLGLLFVVLLLGVATFFTIDALMMVGLIASLLLEHAWLLSPWCYQQPITALRWYAAFYAVFTLFPFLFRRRFADRKYPWIAAALTGPLHFYLAHELTALAFPHMAPGLLPALLAVPPILGLAILAKLHPATNPARDTQLALFGGVALLFITLIFPYQFQREWITISWALEGAALCWLYHRVPHPGLRCTGIALLTVAFVRLGLNPMILSYHIRAEYPIFNWYLYAFGVVSLALYIGARLLAPPRNMMGGYNVPPFLYAMTSILPFILVNIEIADYFSPPGSTVLTFDFTGDFARDMSYSIAWALFALMLLIIGIRRRNAPIRYAGLGLLTITVLKLFLNDLWELEQLYRIAAFIAVAIIAMLSSYLYQRFLALPRPAPER